MSEAFSVGDIVTYIGKLAGKPLQCKVIRVMPVEHAVRTYHVRNSAEAFDRAVPEDALTRVAPTDSDRIFKP
jgi:hypothetical protein